MRIGTNPEKQKAKQLNYKKHRVIIPVYIPDDAHDYFKNLAEVFYASIQSLLQTIDPKNTAITIINNNSKKEVGAFIEALLLQKRIDKYIVYSENKGKVYSVLQEARSSYEDFITIADADVFFFTNWQNEVHQVFDTFKKIGVVGLTPDPHMAFYCNNSLFFGSFFSVNKGKVVNDFDLELFEEGINKKDFFISKNNNWKQKQYYLNKKGVKVVIGASHFASTYRKQVFTEMKLEKPIFVFPGGELKFIDTPIDKLGYYRVSLIKAFAYHMGNNVKQELLQSSLENKKLVCSNTSLTALKPLVLPYIIKIFFTRIFRKLLQA
ncbi:MULTISPECIES: glycosyltransferase family A protein [Flavobacterium]|uniref:Glycosyltransferase 2-like domain-containing protein n=1 Tax=Flavobacterium hankyongi TaxID=1176532 RepID=A0ABP9A2Q0_9FLAO|nr:glycosyltransferase family 2 protein [Flavobacterium sp. N1846]